jgi:hypothetical protein
VGEGCARVVLFAARGLLLVLVLAACNGGRQFAVQRFNQLSWQSRRYGALDDLMVQEKLNLTSDQRQKLNEQNQQWTNKMRLGV